MSQDEAKRQSAEAAVALVKDGMLLGLGTGSTVEFVLVALGRRVRDEGLRISGIPTSLRTDRRARELGLPLTDFASITRLDLAIDGADEVEEASLALIKGLGGALLREKIVAAAAERFLVVADASKLVPRLGSKAPLPVEVSRFGHESTARRLTDIGGAPVLRLAAGQPLVTDGGNFIYDCGGFGPIVNAPMLARALCSMVGVVEHGLFLDMATEALIAGPDGVRRLVRG